MPDMSINNNIISNKKSRKAFIHKTFEILSVRAIDGARTRGLDLGKVARYQLRHYRISEVFSVLFCISQAQYIYYTMNCVLSTYFLKNFKNFFKSIFLRYLHRKTSISVLLFFYVFCNLIIIVFKDYCLHSCLFCSFYIFRTVINKQTFFCLQLIFF